MFLYLLHDTFFYFQALSSCLAMHVLKLDSEDARLVNYFDMIAGTNTSDLATAMITSPKKQN